MGRRAGFIPVQFYLAESKHNLDSLVENVNNELIRSKRCIVVVSEGFNVGSLGETHDAFGHIEYGASKTTVAQVIVNTLNKNGFTVRGYASGQVPGVLQRSASILASVVDINEALEVGRKAVEIGVTEGSGWMATILRKPEVEYEVYYDKVHLEDVAASERLLPAEWLSNDQLDVTDDFVRYAKFLIGTKWPDIELRDELQRFARLKIDLIEKKLPEYQPVRFRKV